MRRLSIAIVIENLHTGGGVERRTSELVHGLMAAGHEVHVYANHWRRGAAAKGVALHWVPMLKLARATKPWSFAWASAKLIPKSKHDLIHTQTRVFRYDLATLGVGCRKAYMDAMGLDPDRPPNRVFNRTMLSIERAMLAPERFADGARIITNSELCRGEIIEHYGVPGESISVVRNGVDHTEFSLQRRDDLRDEARKALGVGPDDAVVLFVGPGFLRKGLHTVIQALGILRRGGGPGARFRLLIVGGGETTDYVGPAADLGIADSITWLGQSSAGEMARYYAAADIFALPTKYDPFANSALEALASGVPVVTSWANGVSEILRDGTDGFIVAPDDSEGLYERLRLLIGDADLRGRIGAEGSKTVGPFTWQGTTEQTMAVYDLMVRDERNCRDSTFQDRGA